MNIFIDIIFIMVNEFFETCDQYGQLHRFRCRQTTPQYSNELNFHIETITPHIRGEFFQFTLKKINDQIYKIIMMNHNHDNEYKGKGIPEYLIPFLMKKLQIQIVSSTNIGIPGEHRSSEANKFWERMIVNKKAIRNVECKWYEFIGSK